jgi:hypothetical protein
MREMPVWQRFGGQDLATIHENSSFLLRSFLETLFGIQIALGGGGGRATAAERHGQKLSTN